MKKTVIIFTAIFFAGWQIFSQCDPRLSMKVPTNPDHFIKSFDAFMPNENDSVLKYTLLLHEGVNYKIDVFETDEFRGGASYSLYEGNKLLGTNYSKSSEKSFPSFNFKCQKSLVYEITVKKIKSKKYCASWVIQELNESGKEIFEFSNPNKSDRKQDATFVIVEKMPEFIAGKEGLNSFRDWVQQNMVYPKEAAEKGISGKVYVSFVVDENGDITDPKIVRSADPLLDKAALELIKSSPKWEKPGFQRGIKVKVEYTIPISYALKPIDK